MNLLKQAPGLAAGQILGIRPEHLELSSAGWELKVDTVELLGAERLVHAHLGTETLTLRLDASLAAPAAGQIFYARPKEGCLHHFNAETGKRL
jgi:sn-glycerol 3-phosphate transport system ATP-binding protein